MRYTLDEQRRSMTHDGMPITAFQLKMVNNAAKLVCQCGMRHRIMLEDALRYNARRIAKTCDRCGGIGFVFVRSES